MTDYTTIAIPLWAIVAVGLTVLIGLALSSHKLSPDASARYTAFKTWPSEHYISIALPVGIALSILAFGGYLWDMIISVYHMVDQLRSLSAPDTSPNDHTEDIRNLARSIAILLGVLSAGATLAFRLIKPWTTERSTRTAEDNLITTQINTAVANLDAMREGDEPNLAVRTAGMLTLEQVALTHPRHYKMVYELLCSYVRQEAPRYAPNTDKEPSDYATKYKYHARDDIKTAMIIIGRRPPEPSLPSNVLSLDRTYLCFIPFIEANFENVSFRYSFIAYTPLNDANLSNAWLSGAIFRRAYMKNANLKGTKLFRADLSDVIYLSQDQIDEAMGDKDTKLPSDLTRPKHWRSQ